MTLNELRYIVAVAQERNFRRAAEKSFISQPALSLAIKKLEDELSVSLFERNKNEIIVTAMGEQIIDQARRVLDEAGRISQLAKGGGDTEEIMIDATHLKAHRTAASLLKKGLFPDISGGPKAG